MQLTFVRVSFLAFTSLVLMLGTTSVVSAEDEVTVETTVVSEETTVEVDTATKPEMKPRPGQMYPNKQIKVLDGNTQNIIKNIPKNLQNLPAKVRLDMINPSTTIKERMKVASTSGERKNIIDTMREKKEGLKDERKAKMENLKERIQMLARTHLGSSITRLSAAIRHFENIAERIESRLLKLSERGVETASVEASLETAISLTATAKTDVDALKALINSVTDASDPETIRAEIRAAIEKATASVKAAHEAFIKTARELSALVRVSGGINSTTTVDVE